MAPVAPACAVASSMVERIICSMRVTISRMDSSVLRASAKLFSNWLVFCRMAPMPCRVESSCSWMPRTTSLIFTELPLDASDSLRTSRATTAKLRPASPARAASSEALSASTSV
jgi:hypothetical protein